MGLHPKAAGGRSKGKGGGLRPHKGKLANNLIYQRSQLKSYITIQREQTHRLRPRLTLIQYGVATVKAMVMVIRGKKFLTKNR